VVLTNAAFFQPGVLSPSAILTVLADADGDLMPDEWETAHGFNPNSATDGGEDSDGDGMINRDEYEAGTNPMDPEETFRVRAFVTGDAVEVSFTAMSNRTYTVEYAATPNGGAWSRLTDLAAETTNRVVTWSDPVGPDATTRYYRVITPRRP
jgi:hypothetical protein